MTTHCRRSLRRSHDGLDMSWELKKPWQTPSCRVTLLRGRHHGEKGMFLYSATSSPSDRSKRCTLFALPGRPVHSDTNSASPGSILAMQQLRATTKSLTFPPVYSQVLVYTAESTGASMERTKMPSLRNSSGAGFEPELTWLRVRHSTAELPRSTGRPTRQWLDNVKEWTGLSLNGMSREPEDHMTWRKRASCGAQMDWIVYAILDSRKIDRKQNT